MCSPPQNYAVSFFWVNLKGHVHPHGNRWNTMRKPSSRLCRLLVRQVLPNWIWLHQLTSCKPRISLPAQILLVSTWQWQKDVIYFALLSQKRTKQHKTDGQAPPMAQRFSLHCRRTRSRTAVEPHSPSPGKVTQLTLCWCKAPPQTGCLPQRGQDGCSYRLGVFSAMTPKPQEMHTELWEHQSQAHKTSAKAHPQTFPKDRHTPQRIQRSQQSRMVLMFYKTNLKSLLNPKEQNWNCASGHCGLTEFKSQCKTQKAPVQHIIPLPDYGWITFILKTIFRQGLF